MSKILVTGSNGFIGKSLVQKLKQLNHSVIEFSGDILEDESYRKLHKEDISHCFHLAAKSFVPDSWKSPYDFIEVNVLGTAKVLEFCKVKNCSLTFVSSYLYGAPNYLPIDEKHPVQTPNPYALSKHQAEELCKFYSEHFKMKVIVVRPFNIYGPGQDTRFLIPELISKFMGKDKVVEVTDLTPKRDYVFISDVTEALAGTLKIGDNYCVLNIGSGYSLSVQEIADKIKTISGSNKTVKSSNETRVNEIPDTVADISLAFDKMGWKPKVSFDEGIKEILKSQSK
jgi:nucleoside-diphosphate-sugar epimerase